MKKVMAATTVFFLIFASVSAVAAETANVAVTDVRALAGTWIGYGVVNGVETPYRSITLYVEKDGSYKAVGHLMLVGQFEIRDGTVYYQSSRSSGKVVIRQDDKGNQTLEFRRDGGEFIGAFERE